MESLLAVAFENISSRESSRIRKGFRQIEGLLAQICLSRTSSNLSPAKRRFSVIEGQQVPSKTLDVLSEDLAFREFFRLQQGFEWNVASRLVSCLERLLGQASSGTNDILIIAALELIQGLLLLHPPSRSLYSQETYMNSLLDLLDPSNCPAIQSSAILVLVTALIDQPRNIRTLERIDGLLTITSLFKSRYTTQQVKLKVVEFLYFYLMPESISTPSMSLASAPTTAMLQRSPSKLVSSTAKPNPVASPMTLPERITRSTQDKQRLLGRYLSNVADLVQDLEENAPFGAVMV